MSDLNEAEIWFETAKAVYGSARGREKYTVAVAQAIHALIKANDALTVKYLGLRSKRHEDAAKLFGDLIKQSKIDSKFADRRKLLTKAAAEKSDFDYKGIEVSKTTATGWLREVERFLEMVRTILNVGRRVVVYRDQCLTFLKFSTQGDLLVPDGARSRG